MRLLEKPYKWNKSNINQRNDFQKDTYWVMTKHGDMMNGYPKKISQGLTDTPDGINAALYYHEDGKPYFFKSMQRESYRIELFTILESYFWQYSRYGKHKLWPRAIVSIFENQVPIVSWLRVSITVYCKRHFFSRSSKFTVGFSFKSEKNIFFISQVKNYKFSVHKIYISFQNSPPEIDAAFQLNNTSSFLFHQNKYWKVSGDPMRIEKGFPRSLSRDWFNCLWLFMFSLNKTFL